MGSWLPVALLASAGIALEAWAAVALGWRRAFWLTTVPPDPALPALVMSGPFRLVRHPQALGGLLLAAACALGWRGAGGWLMAAAAASLVLVLARREDRLGATQFGAAYDRYRRAVPFLLPKLR